MQYILTVSVEINDDAAAILDRTLVGGAAGAIKDMARTLMSGPGIKRVTVDVDSDDAPESDAQRPADPADTYRQEYDSATRRRPSAARKAPAADNDGPGLIDDRPQHASGRPKNIPGATASDGGPVREWGERSPQNLAIQGIDVYGVEAQQPVKRTRERGTSETRATVRKAAPKSAGKANFPVHTRRK